MGCGGQDVKTIKNYVIYGFNNLSAAVRIKLVCAAGPSDLVPGPKLTYVGTILKDTSESDVFRYVVHPINLRKV